MKRIKNLMVTCSYTVSLSDIEVSDAVYNGLMNKDSFDCDEFLHGNEVHAMDWLSDHIRESDAMNWEYEIDDMEGEEE